jgi:hypothetical protein
VLPGAYRISQDTVLAYPPAGPGVRPDLPRSGLAAPPARPGAGARRCPPAGRPPRSERGRVHRDPLSITTSALRGNVEPLPAAAHLAAIQLPARALACWPYRFLTGPDAEDTPRLFEHATGRGTAVMLMASYAHPGELEPGPAPPGRRPHPGAPGR